MFVVIELFGDTVLYEYTELQHILDHIKRDAFEPDDLSIITECYYTFIRGKNYIKIKDVSNFGYIITGVADFDQSVIEFAVRKLFLK